jgi:hypothetical protein
MQLASYLTTSRHDICYFRGTLPKTMHPSGRTRHVRVSICTKSPRQAQSMSRALVLAGQSALRSASLAAMTYEQMTMLPGTSACDSRVIIEWPRL